MADRDTTGPSPTGAARSEAAPGGASEGGFDEVLGALRQVVERLEGGSLSLDESLAVFEQGVRLSRRGTSILDAAERRVEILSRGEDGADVRSPFDAEHEEPAGPRRG